MSFFGEPEDPNQRRVRPEDHIEEARLAAEREQAEARARGGTRPRQSQGEPLPDFASLEQLLGQDEHTFLARHTLRPKSTDELLGKPRSTKRRSNKDVLDWGL